MHIFKQIVRRYIGGFNFLFLLIIGRIPSHVIRLFLYRLYGMKIGKKSYIYMGAEIRNPKGITIGENTSVGHNVILDGRNQLSIGDNVNISSGVWIWSMQHDAQSPDFASSGGKVVIADYAWISGRTTILPSITIGKGAVVATGAVVTKSVDAYTIVAGVPATKISERTKNLNYNLTASGPTPFV